MTRHQESKAQGYHTHCSTCGYVGRSFKWEAEAENDGDEHEIALGTNQQHHYTRVVKEILA